MSTVMQWGNSEGIQGRCDAKCHNAKDPHCDCMCGGRYHGAQLQPVGLRQAMENHETEIIESANKKAAAMGLEIRFKSLVELFGQQPLEGIT